MKRKVIVTTDAPQAIGPYSQAVEAGGFVFVSGQIPIDPKTGNLVEGDVRVPGAGVMENAKAILDSGRCQFFGSGKKHDLSQEHGGFQRRK